MVGLKHFLDFSANMPREEFCSKVDAVRSQLVASDKKMLVSKGTVFDEESSDIPEGRFSTVSNGVEFDCIFHNDKDNQDCLWIILSGSKNPGDKLPIFRRWSYYSLIRGFVLSIADPMLKIYENLSLGWYYGDKDHCYMLYLLDIVRAIADKKNVSNDNIYFLGSSGGGYAALYCADQLSGSTAVAINPQIQLPLYWNLKKIKFEEIVNVDLTEKDKYNRNNLVDRIIKNHESKFLIIENIRSQNDWEQLNKIHSEIGKYSHFGLNKLSDNIITWLYDLDSSKPHSSQEWKTMFLAIEYLAKNLDNVENLQYLYSIFNEFWHEHKSYK